LAQSVVEVRRVVYTGLQQHYSDAQKLRQNGMIADAELLHAKMFFYEAGRELKKSVRDAAIVAQGLQSTLAGGATDSIVPTDHLFVVADIETLDWFRTTALANNPLLAQVDIKKSMAEQGVKANRADLLPTLAAMGKYDIAKYQLSEYSPEWMVGVGLKWTLFDGASGHRKLKASKLVLEQVQEADLKANSDVEAGVTKYYQELMSAREQVEQLQMSLDFAAEYLRIREKAFKEGMATSTEVVDAQLNLAKVRTERLSAVYKFDVALIKLLQTCGIPEQFELLRQTGIVIN
jgi:outer membrane protein TolC